jgi:hypothetical protein
MFQSQPKENDEKNINYSTVVDVLKTKIPNQTTSK